MWLKICKKSVFVIVLWAGPSEKGAYGFSNIMRANDVDDVIYDVTIGKYPTCDSDVSLENCNILFSKVLEQNQ